MGLLADSYARPPGELILGRLGVSDTYEGVNDHAETIKYGQTIANLGASEAKPVGQVDA